MRNRTLHEFVKRLFSPIRVRIKGGPLRGARWILSTGVNFITGAYEPEKTRCIVGTTEEGMAILDIGAHVGYFSLIMSRRAGPRGEIHAFEPRKLNRRFLKTHLRLNGADNVRVYSLCLGHKVGPVKFETRTGTGTGHLSNSGNVTVRMTTIDTLVQSGTVPVPDLIKIDIEGAEIQALEGGYDTIRKALPTMILAVHGDELERQCRTLLEPLGYHFKDLGQTTGDREFLLKTPIRN